MRLFIAEKPSLARAILAVLPKPHQKSEGFYTSANGDVVTWCLGHLLEQAEPEQYDPRYKRWHLDDLPIVPTDWQLTPRKDTKKQLATIKKLSKQATLVVHAGDPDREGQLLVDEVINYAKLTKAKAATVQRCLISDLTPNAVKKAVDKLKDNREFIPLSVSALARARADWLYGLNLTRAYTLKGQQAGYKGVLSVGRVQTPLLGLVVARDQSISDFKPKDYYQVEVDLETILPDAPGSFRARWVPSEACAKWQDEEGRVLSQQLATNVVSRVVGKQGTVTHLETKDHKQKAPLPFSLSSLQMEANRRFSMSAQQVLDTCQTLYERYQLITYPRSDCRYLPKEHLSQAPDVIAAIGRGCNALSEVAKGANTQLTSRAWNDSQVGAHHGIIPTQKAAPAGLSDAELKVYTLVARFYLAQFYPDLITVNSKVDCEIEGGLFRASSKQIKQLGWKQVTDSRGQKVWLASAGDGDAKDDQNLELHSLPPLKVGQALHCQNAEVLTKQTQPPKAFTEATLLAAMTGIARFIDDTELRSVLRETDGLGTEATRAGMIELLLRRSFICRNGKAINATALGKNFISVLPERVVKPDMTARWEQQLSLMAAKSASYDVFMASLNEALLALLEDKRTPLPAHVSAALAAMPSQPAGKAKRRKQPARAKSPSRASKAASTRTSSARGAANKPKTRARKASAN